MDHSSIRLAPAILIIFVIPACTTYRAYSGPKKPPEQTASVVAGTASPGEREKGWEDWSKQVPAAVMYTDSLVEIYKVDNKILPQTRRRQVDLLPGRHCVGVKYSRAYVFIVFREREEAEAKDLCFDAQAGHIYGAYHGYSAETGDFLWMVDQADGTLVAGDLPASQPAVQ
jgi:hypothetical protein